MNNLDPEVAEQPEQLIVYGGIGKAARNWECYDAIVATLKRLKNDETLLVQSGKPVGVFRTHENAPRVLIANSNLVPHWATWDEFRRLDALGLTMYGQMTAGSWIYIGTQGILQGTYECFAALAKKHFGDSLRGKLVVTAGLGGMGGAQPLAATMNEATALVAEVDRTRIQRRLDKRYLDEEAPSLDAAIARALEARDNGEAISIGVVANAVELLEALIARGIVPDVLTDQTSAHDELTGYVPAGMSFDEALALREASPEMYIELSYETMARHMRAMIELQNRGAITFDYGNNLRGQALKAGVDERVRRRRLRAAVHPPAVLRRKGTVPLGRAVRRSERPLRHRRSDPRALPARRSRCIAGSAWRRSASSSRDCRRASAGSATASATRRDCSSTGSSRRRKVSRADRHRPRSSRRRFRGLAESRDRSDEGRLRRDRRLADPQRPAQHRGGRDVGLRASRRRRRHRLLAARRHGHRRRRHAKPPRSVCSACSRRIRERA